jgi:perosamine synthetase
MNKLIELSSKYDFEIVEDACEAFTSSFDNKKIGSFGKIGVFSFYGNKFGGFSGEGGAVVTDDDDIYKYLRLLNGQGQDPTRKFWHLIPGNNFRMTNVQAAILNSQLNRLDTTILKKNHIAALYKQYLDSDLKWQVVPHTGIHCYWMVTVSHWLDVNWYDKLQTILKNNNIESRPVFPAIHTMPAASYIDAIFYGNYSNSEFLNRNGICLPSGPGTTDEEIKFVCTVINNAI